MYVWRMRVDAEWKGVAQGEFVEKLAQRLAKEKMTVAYRSRRLCKPFWGFMSGAFLTKLLIQNHFRTVIGRGASPRYASHLVAELRTHDLTQYVRTTQAPSTCFSALAPRPLQLQLVNASVKLCGALFREAHSSIWRQNLFGL